MNPTIWIVIPARLQSSRLAEKVLLHETGKYLVQHVYERALLVPAIARVLVATDSEAVAAAVCSFGGDVVMTSPDHPSGTDRVAEATRCGTADIVLNLQADEPEIDPRDVAALAAAMAAGAPMGTLVRDDLDDAAQADDAVVKALCANDARNRLLAHDFTRAAAPGALRHLGVYAFRGEFLQQFCELPPTEREMERRLEQMRALDNGHEILAIHAQSPGAGIDTPADYAAFVARSNTAR